MALTKVTKSGITNNAIDADKLEDGTILAADITPGTITADKLDSTLNLSSKTVTLPNTSVTNAMLAGSIANAKLANSSITVNGTSVSLGSSISAGALDWQAVITADGSTSTTGVAGRGYFIDTTSTAHTFTLPGSPTIGDTIAIVDYAGTFATNKLTIARNGNNIQGVANNSQIGTNRASVTLVYVDATKGWVYQNESNVADLGQTLFITATGGTITTSGDYKIHTFTGDGCFVVSQSGAGQGPSIVDYLVVAGGGGGGVWSGGGGGGGFREGKSSPAPIYSASPLVAPAGLTVSATTYPVTVGGGGVGNPGPSILTGPPLGTNGSPSVFSTITSTGGGKGGSGGPSCSGGSGGGNGGLGNTPPTSPPQGNDGGTAGGFPGYGGGGGGGAGGVGQNGTTPGPAGAGGVGSPTSISGTSVSYAGGGGGGASAPINGGTGGAGSPCGTGGAGSGNSTGVAGTTNRGGGGGSGGYAPGQAGGNGGSGIVIIRYKFQ